MNFVHLHIHSHYSLLEGLPKIEDLVYEAKKKGMTALALTDYGSMYGIIEFFKEAKKRGLKPILGMEAYLALGSRFDKRPHLDEENHHLVLLAENEIGYKNLMKLSTIGHLEGKFGVARIDKEVLKQYHQGLIALSGCREGEVPKIIWKTRDLVKAREAAEEYSQIFGPNNFFLELQDHPDLEGQVEINNGLIEIATQTGLPLVVTRDVHYLHPEDREAQDILVCIRDGYKASETNRPNFLQVDRSFAEAQDVASRFRHVPEALENTVKIADRCTVDLVLGKWHFPALTLPQDKTAVDVLREEANAGMQRLIKEITPATQERLEYELSIIEKKGYAPYFLAVADYVKWSRSHGIITTTRGSGAGSLVSYCIGITTVNPLYFKLPFERFLNPFRPSPPDIDMDFADNRRDEVIAYVTEHYGADHVAQITTFGTMAARGSVRDVGRALGMSYNFCDQIAKMIPMGTQGFPMTLKKALEITPELYALYNEDPEVKRLLDLAQKIEGCARHTSQHAAGVVISPRPLTDFTPLQRESDGDRITTQYEMHAVEDAGVLKMDFLGVRNLSILGDAIKIVEKTRGVKVDLDNIPWDDPAAFAMLARGETGGLFQLGGSGMTRYLEELKPTSIFDIMAMVALFRPGPMESIPEFIRRKHNPKLIKYLDPRMKDYLDMSYGVITYQDDVLLTAINIAGYNWEEADKLRKAMGKKIPEEMAAQKEKFLHGCINNGLTQSLANELWGLIEPFAAYGFNKAHAASYAVIAYNTSYMKANFPEEYMAAVLSAEMGDLDEVADLVQECKDMGIEILAPDVNESFEKFAVVPRKNEQSKPTIRFGLEAIKNVGAHIAEEIIKERKKSGVFSSLEDFLGRVQDKDLNKKSLESLIKSGALDRFGERGLLLNNIELLTAFNKDAQKEKTNNQAKLFDLGSFGATKLNLKPSAPISRAERLGWEKELIGLYISDHPFGEFLKLLGHSFTRLVNIFKITSPTNWVAACGMVGSAKSIITKKGSQMLFVNLEDGTGQVEVIVFPKIYEQLKNLLVEGANVCILGKYSDREGEKKIIAEKAEILTKENIEIIKKRFADYANHQESSEAEEEELVIKITQPLTGEQITNLKKIFSNFPGEVPVVMTAQGKKVATNFKVKKTEELLKQVQTILKNPV
ncbi:MAG TPA: DNA polymerase III subunit alpha [Candidatus Magasanikbacteria bacterium]|nr:DNA polymerase III subunit alpha [Candidatus Magasanikbacteria bacterium]